MTTNKDKKTHFEILKKISQRKWYTSIMRSSRKGI